MYVWSRSSSVNISIMILASIGRRRQYDLLVILCWSLLIESVSISFIVDVVLEPECQSNYTVIHNQSIEQCICSAYPEFIGMNWYGNNSCLLFYNFPTKYSLKPTISGRLYFIREIFPSESECCVPPLTDLLRKLNNSTRISSNIPSVRNLIEDNFGYIVTLRTNPATLYRYHPQNLSLIDNLYLGGGSVYTIGFTNNTYFVGFGNGPITAIDSTTLIPIGNTTSPSLQVVRSIIFLDYGRIMVVSSHTNGSLSFFNLTDQASFTYTFMYQQQLSYKLVHGLAYMSNTRFYATEYNNGSIYLYSKSTNQIQWNESLAISFRSHGFSGKTPYLRVDGFGRLWCSSRAADVFIFDSNYAWLGTLSLNGETIIDILITKGYVLYFSVLTSNATRIIRIDPQIECS